MKSSTIPALRVSSKLRKEAESMLREGETLSGFVLESLTRGVEGRRAQEAFLERGLASAARARSSGRYIPAQRVIGKLRIRQGSRVSFAVRNGKAELRVLHRAAAPVASGFGMLRVRRRHLPADFDTATLLAPKRRGGR